MLTGFLKFHPWSPRDTDKTFIVNTKLYVINMSIKVTMYIVYKIKYPLFAKYNLKTSICG